MKLVQTMSHEPLANKKYKHHAANVLLLWIWAMDCQHALQEAVLKLFQQFIVTFEASFWNKAITVLAKFHLVDLLQDKLQQAYVKHANEHESDNTFIAHVQSFAMNTQASTAAANIEQLYSHYCNLYIQVCKSKKLHLAKHTIRRKKRALKKILCSAYGISDDYDVTACAQIDACLKQAEHLTCYETIRVELSRVSQTRNYIACHRLVDSFLYLLKPRMDMLQVKLHVKLLNAIIYLLTRYEDFTLLCT